MLDSLGQITAEDVNSERLLEKLASRTSVRAESETIWKSLTRLEQQVLKIIAGHEQQSATHETEQAMSMLVQKRLVSVDKLHQTLRIDPPLFRVFVFSNPSYS